MTATLKTHDMSDDADFSKLYTLMEKMWSFCVDTFDPEVDSIVHFVGQESDGGITFYATPWQNDFEKTMILNLLRDDFKKRGIQRYVLMTEAWTASYPADTPDEVRHEQRPSERPDRLEKLILLGVDPESREVMQYGATILRDADNKRSLGEKEVLEGMTKVGGQMLDLLGPFTPRTVQ